MAEVKPVLKDDGTITGKFTISADELLDIRKHALECACHLRAQGGYDSEKVLAIAKKFEEHLVRNSGND